MRTITVALALLCLQLPLPVSATVHSVSFGHYSVNGADGFLAYPTDSPPTTLLVIAHWCCIAWGDWNKDVANGSFYRMYSWARNFGIAVVAMNFSGPGHWDIKSGAQETIEATLDLQARWNITRTILWGISMGGEVSGMALAERPDLFDYWVDEFGVTNLPEQFAFLASSTIGITESGQSWMLEGAGGPLGLLNTSLSPALNAPQMGSGALKHAYIVHGIADPIVPITQAVEMHAAFLLAGIPSSLRLVTSGADPGDGVEGPYLPGLGIPFIPTPEGHTLGQHNVIAGAEAMAIISALASGSVPDGSSSNIQIVDYHLCFVHEIEPLVPCRITL